MKNNIKINKPYHDRNRITVGGFEPTITQQHLENETNINAIMARALKTGAMPAARHSAEAMFGDFSSGDDYQTMLNKVIALESSFDSLPSDIRNRFRNNPAMLLDFLSDENNRDEAIELGLLDKVNTPASNQGQTLDEAPPVVPSGEPPKSSQGQPGSGAGAPGEPAKLPTK
jgi:phage internal scaffolding protein